MGKPYLLSDNNEVDDDNHDITNQADIEYAGRSFSSIADEIINLDIPGNDELGSGKQLQYKCEECDASFKSKSGLYRHTSSKHEGIAYSCQYCRYKATTQGSLKRHKESAHEGVKYQCNQCEYQATRKDNLNKHKESDNEGLK